MRDLLIRYLLGELDDAEQRQLEERLHESPELRRELDYLRACFTEGGEVGAVPTSEPPSGLAERTAEQVNRIAEDPSEPVLPVTSAVEPPTSQSSWSLADISVAAGVFLAVSMLLLPALRGSRDTSRRAVCTANLQNMGYYLARYAEDHGGYLPRVGTKDCAGVFALRLVSDGYVPAEELHRLLICPASKQRDERSVQLIIKLPSGQTLNVTPPAEIARLVQLLKNSYAYRLGYVDNNRYYFHCLRNRPRSCEPIMADAPRFDASGPSIANHNGCGLNVLYADGSVRFQKCLNVAGLDDLLYLNSLLKPAAGQGPYDVVLVSSEGTPRVEVDEASGD